jgi:hypothetical protein
VIHLPVVSPPDVGTLLPMLHSEPAVTNLTMLPGAVSHPDGDAVHFDILHGAANKVIGRLRDLGLEQRGSIVLENWAFCASRAGGCWQAGLHMGLPCTGNGRSCRETGIRLWNGPGCYGGLPGSAAGCDCCLARCTAPRNTRIPRPRTSRSRSIWAITTSLADWLTGVMSPKPTVLNVVTVK